MCRIVLTGRSHLSTTGWAEPFRKEEVDRGGGKTGRNPWLPEGQPREKEGPTTGESDRGERVSKTALHGKCKLQSKMCSRGPLRQERGACAEQTRRARTLFSTCHGSGLAGVPFKCYVVCSSEQPHEVTTIIAPNCQGDTEAQRGKVSCPRFHS